MSGFFIGKKCQAERKEKQMQGFRIYNDPIGMLLLHSGSLDKSECEMEVDTAIDNKAC